MLPLDYRVKISLLCYSEGCFFLTWFLVFTSKKAVVGRADQEYLEKLLQTFQNLTLHVSVICYDENIRKDL